jgi:hypothetical protein
MTNFYIDADGDEQIIDETEPARRQLVQDINANPGSREFLENIHGQVWDTTQLQDDFLIERFMAPFVVGTKKDTDKRGSLMYQPTPRFYFSWTEDEA